MVPSALAVSTSIYLPMYRHIDQGRSGESRCEGAVLMSTSVAVK